MTDLLRTQLQAALGTAYSLQGELGGGGMSRVFVARELPLHRDVVVKVLAPELAQGMSVERFAREVRLVAALQEPHIVPVLTAGVTAEGLPYYTMPFVEGENLRMRIMHAPVSRADAVGVLRNIAQALSYAHAHGIVHRDIKPENVLLSSGTAVVTDFGIAKALSVSKAQAPDGPADATLTTFGASLGTPAYMAPEQAAGDDVDARADIYAWGVVAYELIAGQHPFVGRKTAQQLIAAHIAEPPPPLPAAVPAALATLVMRCLAKTAASRPDSAAELVKLLDAATAGSPQVPAARRWLRALAVVTLALLMIVLGGWYGVLSPADRATLGVLARRKPVELRVNRIVVAPFRNETGDAALAALGPLAADVLTSGLSSLPDLEVVDARTAAASGEVARQIPRLFRRGSDELALADEVGAGVVIDGSYYRDGDSVRVRSRVLDAASGAIRKALPEDDGLLAVCTR